MSHLQLAGLNAGVGAAALYAMQLANANGFNVVITSTRRTWAEQTALYQHWLDCQARGLAYSSECPYPANQPGDSAHQWGLAFDSVPAGDDGSELARDDYRWDWWRQIREWVGFRVPDNDIVHAEIPDWRSYKQALMDAGDVGR